MSTWILISLMSSWLGTQSIQGIFSRMPKGQLVMIEYSEQGTMAGYRYYGCVELQKDGSVTVKAQKESYGEIIEKKVKTEVLTELRDIVKGHKMYRYKERYRPFFEVLDGYSWSFTAKFSDGESISSAGYNARPSGEGLKTLMQYMMKLVTDN